LFFFLEEMVVEGCPVITRVAMDGADEEIPFEAIEKICA